MSILIFEKWLKVDFPIEPMKSFSLKHRNRKTRPGSVVKVMSKISAKDYLHSEFCFNDSWIDDDLIMLYLSHIACTHAGTILDRKIDGLSTYFDDPFAGNHSPVDHIFRLHRCGCAEAVVFQRRHYFALGGQRYRPTENWTLLRSSARRTNLLRGLL